MTDQPARDEALLQGMAAALSHRGGAYNTWLDSHAALAQIAAPDHAAVFTRTLAGIPYAVVCDSLLTETPTLRNQLIALGYSFETQGDAELILAAYLHSGEDCAALLSGGFAFVLWDGGQRRAFAARDAMGTRPLFYAQAEATALLASEIKGLLTCPALAPAVDNDGLCELLGLGPGRTPGRTAFKNVQELPPGHCLRLDGDGLHRRAFWQLKSFEHTDDEATTVAHTRELLLRAIERQLADDAPLCSFLSGGLDSSVITAVVAKQFLAQGREPLSTYSFDYVDNAAHFHGTAFQPETDAPYVQKVLAHCGTKHTGLLCDSRDLPAALLPAMRARDLPGMADVDASLLLFCRQVKADFGAALSGECADEVFGGYPWFHKPEYFQAQTFPWNTDPTARLKVLNPALVSTLRLEAYVQGQYEAMLAQVPRLPGEDAEAARRREIAYLNLYGFMQTLLDRGDRMSMASGLEIRTPYCDPELVQYVFNVPWHLKALGGETKGLLRAAAAGLLPDDVLHRRKSPFPKTHNPLYEQLVQRQVLAMLDDHSAPVRPLIDVAAVRKLCQGHADYGQPWFGQLMAGPQLLAWLLQINAWLTEYKISL